MMNFLLFILFALSQIVFADPFYYGQFTENKMRKMNSSQLRKSLHKILSGYHVQRNNAPDIITGSEYPRNAASHNSIYKHKKYEYKHAKAYMYKNIAPVKIDSTKHMKTIYCNDLFRFPKKYKTIGEAVAKMSINAEHTWPRSRFFSGTKAQRKNNKYRYYQEADLHHIFPSLNHVNSARQSYMFAEVKTSIHEFSKNNQKVLKNMNQNSGDGAFGPARIKAKGNAHSIYFEPPDESKGIIARALLYFSIRYERTINPTEFYFLRKWHIEHPPTEAEYLRNDQVFEYQLVRNPFVDRPWLIDYLNDQAFLKQSH